MFPKAKTLLPRPKGGYSEPLAVRCDDDKSYVLKFGHGDPAYAATRLVYNEVLSKAVGDAIGIPIPPASLVEVNDEFLEVHAGLIEPDDATNPPRTPGFHFGSEIVDNLVELKWDDDDDADEQLSRIFDNLGNRADLAGTIAFDTLILVRDRGYPPNNLVQLGAIAADVDSGKYRYRAIDHGNAFSGPAWSSESLGREQGSDFVSRGLNGLHEREVSPGCFASWLTAIAEQITDEFLEAENAKLPAELKAATADLASLKAFVQTRKAALGERLEQAFFGKDDGSGGATNG